MCSLPEKGPTLMASCQMTDALPCLGPEKKLGLVWYKNRIFPRPQLLPQVAKHFPNCEQEGYTFFFVVELKLKITI